MLRFLMCCLVAASFGMLSNEVNAQGPKVHAVAMAETGGLYHAGGRVENVAQVGPVFPRLQALAMYSRSPQHRQNFWSAPVRMVLTTRIARTGTGKVYVVNRGSFR